MIAENTIPLAVREDIRVNGLKNCTRCWAFDGAGSAKFGWYYTHSGHRTYLGSTKSEILARIQNEEAYRG